MLIEPTLPFTTQTQTIAVSITHVKEGGKAPETMRFRPREGWRRRPSSSTNIIIALQGQLQAVVFSPLLLGLLLLLLRAPSAEGFSLPRSKLTSLSPQYPPPPDFGVGGHHHAGASWQQPHVMMTPRDFLAQRMPGPYTCLRARDRSLLGFDFHLARLLHSIRASGGHVENKELRSMMLEAVEEAVEEALSLHTDDDEQDAAAVKRSNKGPLDAFVTVHAALSGGANTQVSLSAHACAMPFAVPPPPLTLEVRGDGRREPEVKHSKWLWDRQELERFKVGAGGEVALSRPLPGGGGREVLEGLVTNLFVFREGVLVTAGGGVLKGHVREMVLRSARALGLEVREDEPLRLEEVHTWEEAFLTGSGRILAPIARVEGTSLGLSPVQLPTPTPGPQTTRLRQRLLYDIDRAWEPLHALCGVRG